MGPALGELQRRARYVRSILVFTARHRKMQDKALQGSN